VFGLSKVIPPAGLRLNLRAVLIIGSVGLPVLLLLIGAFLVQQTAQNVQANRSAVSASVILTQVQTMFGLLQEAESGQRGYILTGEAVFLVPYHDALRQLPATTARLNQLTADHNHLQGQIIALEADANLKLKELAKTIALSDGTRTARRWRSSGTAKA
jgi:CHASE3 domain sensor protein